MNRAKRIKRMYRLARKTFDKAVKNKEKHKFYSDITGEDLQNYRYANRDYDDAFDNLMYWREQVKMLGMTEDERWEYKHDM